MADNYSVLDSAGATQTISARDEGGGVKSNRVTPRVNGQDVGPANPVPTAPQAVAPPAAGTLQAAAAANGTGTDFAVGGYGTVVLTVTGDAAAAATVNFLVSEDGTTFVPYGAVQLGTTGAVPVMSVAVGGNFVGVFQMPVSGLTKVRASVTGYSAGHVTVTAHAAAGDYSHKAVLSVGSARIVSQTLTRQANTTAYGGKTSIQVASPAPLQFVNAFRGNGLISYLTKARLTTDNPAFSSRIRLWLFNATPTTPTDNASMALLYSETANRLGYIEFPAPVIEGVSSTCVESLVVPGQNNLPMLVGGSSGTVLYGLLEAYDAFTPTSGQNFTITLSIEDVN